MRRIVGIGLLLVMLLGVLPVSASNFPDPDWGALLKERTNMVKQTEFELYAEAAVETAPFYGARLEPRGGAFLGSIAETSEQLQPLGSYLTYVEHMYQTDLYHPANQMIRQDQVATLVGWTIHNLETVDYDQVRRTLDTLHQYNKPMYIRFANEMNCSALGNNPQKYIEVFRNVANMIHEYPNFAVVWSPNDMGALDRDFDYFYPGDEYVDWVGISNYMTKYFSGEKNTAYKDSVYFMTGDYAWATNKIKPFMEFLRKNNIQKPVMISEGGVATNNKFGEDCRSWAEPRLRNMLWYLTMKYPQIKMINYFDNQRKDETERYNISEYPYAVELFNDAKNHGPYITEFGTNADFVFQRANDAGTLTAKDGVVPVYTMAYFEGLPNASVNYHVDGAWYHGSNQIPYRCNLNLAGLTDGKHTLKISSGNTAKEYAFYKKGNYIRFGAEPEPTVPQLGDVVNHTLYTDIVAKINNCDVESFNIDGYTVIVAEDLTEYGFDVSYHDGERALYINRNWERGITSSYTAPYKDKSRIGEKMYDVLYTDIKTYLEGQEVTSYNIGGRTMIYMDSLGVYGSVAYDDSIRTISLTMGE